MMNMLILAQMSVEGVPGVPDEGQFFSLAKIIVMLIFVFLWAWPASWCSRDSKNMSLNQFMWGLILLSGSVLGWFLWIVTPLYALGLIFFLLLNFGTILVYAIYRDSLVEPEDKILRFENIMAAIRGEKTSGFEVTEKVRLATPMGQEPAIPEELEEQKIYQLVQDLLFDALWRRAGEIIIKPAGEIYRVIFRIDGVASEYTQIEKHTARAVIEYIKTIAKMNVEERRLPQSATLVAQQVNVDRKVELDIETQGSTAGETLKIDIRAEEAKFTINDIGFTKSQLEKFQKIINEPKGLVIFSGMPKSGVSTTLYAVARSMDAFTQNIHSVEQHPLMTLDNITQNIYQENSDTSFDKFLRSVSRREPDVILVDPCFEPETAVMIGQIVADKNKKIFATLRASSAVSALSRIVRWINSSEIAGEILLAVTFQRLVRKLCPACKEAYRPNPDMLRKLNLSSKSTLTFYRPPSQLVDKKGNPIICPTCQGTGYLGRTGIFEMLIIDDNLRKAIMTGDGNKIKIAVKQSKFVPWERVALEKVVEGITSIQEIVRVTKDSQKK